MGVGSSIRVMNSNSVELARLDGARVTLGMRQVRRLTDSISGTVLCAGDPGWVHSVAVWNGGVVRTPPRGRGGHRRRMVRTADRIREPALFGRFEAVAATSSG
jgi:hypothetical protein